MVLPADASSRTRRCHGGFQGPPVRARVCHGGFQGPPIGCVMGPPKGCVMGVFRGLLLGQGFVMSDKKVSWGFSGASC